jgi:cytochrome b561
MRKAKLDPPTPPNPLPRNIDMPLKSDATTWGGLAKFFHWTIVLLIIVQATVGLIMVDLPKKPNIIPVYNLHKSIGLTILSLAVLRLAWRWFDRRPQEHPSIPQWQAFGARAGHALLYALLFAVPLSGWWFDSVSALRPLYWFGLVEVPHLTGPDKSLKDLASQTHAVLFWLLVVVAVGHAAMALIHQFVNRDGTLARMLPGGRRLAAVPTVAISETTPEILETNHVQTTSSSAPGPDPVDPDLVRRDGA